MLKAYINEINISTPKRKLLHDVYFAIKPGQILAILGENGSGKSTLLNAIAGLTETREILIDGRIECFGIDILKASPSEISEIRSSLRLLFQDPVSSFDPLKRFKFYFGLIPDPDSLEKLITELDLPERSDLEKLYPSQVSSGMAQRVALALAFAAAPKLVLLDEPTSAVDVYTANSILKMTKKWIAEGGRSAVVVTQDAEFANAAADRILRIEDGTLKNSRKDKYQPKK